MDYNTIAEKYQKLGIGDYRLRTADDVKAIYGIDMANIYGMNKLNQMHAYSAEIFNRFFINYLNGWGLEARGEIQPLAVAYCKDKGNGIYIRFKYQFYGCPKWLHVKNDHTWY